MSLMSQMVENLLNGVSQLPAPLRPASQATEQVNGLSRFSDGGPSKRPNTVHVAKLTSTITGADSAFLHPINFGDNQRYLTVIADSNLKVYDKETGLSQEVLFPQGKGYLTIQPGAPIAHIVGLQGIDGVLLANFTANTGFGFTKYGVEPNTQFRAFNGGFLSWGNASVPTALGYTYQWPVPLADHTVTASFFFPAPHGIQDWCGVTARGNLSNPGCYFGNVDEAGSWRFSRVSTGGSFTALATGTIVGFDDSIPHTISLVCTGSNIVLKVDGVQVATASDSTYTAAGFAGIVGSGTGDNNGNDTTNTRAIMTEFSIIYAAPTLASNDKFRAVTVDNRTFITNSTVKALRDTTKKAIVPVPQAIIYLEQADFSTLYSVTIDGVTATYETVVGDEASQRREIGTDVIAALLRTQLVATFSAFQFNQYGSMILVQRTDGGSFSINATDGLADSGIIVIKSQVQRTTDLPLRSIHGYVLEVVGGPEEARDTYWVKFNSQGSDDFRGVWEETVRPGEGIAFNPATMPHELTYTDRLTDELESRGFPNQPVVSAVLPSAVFGTWLDARDGTPVSTITFPSMRSQNSDISFNLASANGGPVDVVIAYQVVTTKMDPEETLTVHFAHHDGATLTDLLTRSYSAGLYQWHEAKFTVPVAAANSDIVVYITYSSGSTPDKEGLVRVPPTFTQRMKYFVFAARDVTWVTNRKYPKGTAWNININTSLNANYTQTDDLTGAQIAAQLEPIVEALTGVDSTIETTPTGTAIRITLTAGGLAAVLATGTFSATTRFWNPDITIGFTGLVGKTLKNLSDGSSGTISDAYAQGITVAALTGGVENRFRNGDLIVVVDSSTRFTFRQIRWKDRNAGDSITNPWPSILDNYVLDVFFHRGRLGLLSAGNVVMSEAGQAGNLFRTATTDLLDSDPIDVKPAASGTIKFHSAAEWGGLMTLWTDSAQYEIKGGDLLTPSTVQLPQISRYASSSLRPLTLGQRMFFSRGMERFTRIFEYRRRPNDEQPDALDVTRGVPRYLPGNPYLMTGDAAVGFLALITDDDRAAIFVHSFHYEQDQQLQSSWSRWELPPGSTVAGMDIVLGTLAIVVVRADGLYLETLELDELEAEPAPLLDRLISATPTSGTYTLPYSIATNGSQGTLVCVRQDTGALVAVTRPAATTVSGAFSGVAVWFGVTYGFEYTFSPLYPRKSEGEAETRGRLQLSRGVLHYRGSQAFNVNTTPEGRPTRTKVFTAADAEDGEFPFPIQSRNTTVSITVTNDTHLPSVLTGLDWEGQYVTRSRRQ